MTPSIAAACVYAALLALIGGWLGLNTGRWRGRTGIILGDGGNEDLVRALRGQANFVEIVPVALILLLAVALFGVSVWVIHGFGIVLALARIIHGVHFSGPGKPRWQRSAGAALSALVVVGLALIVIAEAFRFLMSA